MIPRDLTNFNAASARQDDPLQTALSAAGIDPARFGAVVAYESTDASGNPTVEVKRTERFVWPDPTPIRDPKPTRGECPRCGDPLVSDSYYMPGRGYRIVFACTGCDYEKVL